MGEFEDWWSSDLEMENETIQKIEAWEDKQRDLPEKVRYRGDLYFFEFKIMTSPSSLIWRFSTMNLRDFTINFNSDMGGDLRKKVESLFRNDGFINGISCEIIGHICNLEILPFADNRNKWSKSSISIDHLLNEIEKFEKTLKF